MRRGDIVTGLVSEIQPDRDVINQEGEGYTFAARRLTTAVVTQLFSYMIGKGIQYGYVCTSSWACMAAMRDHPTGSDCVIRDIACNIFSAETDARPQARLRHNNW